MALARGHRLDAYRCEGATRLMDCAAEEYIVSAVREIGRGISLLIGLAFLGSCLAARELLVGSSTPLDNILSEGLLILGWGAMWKPVEITQGVAPAAIARDSLPESRLASA